MGQANRTDDDARYYLGRLLGCLPDPVRRIVQPIVRLAWRVVRRWLPSGAAGRTVDRSR